MTELLQQNIDEEPQVQLNPPEQQHFQVENPIDSLSVVLQETPVVSGDCSATEVSILPDIFSSEAPQPTAPNPPTTAVDMILVHPPEPPTEPEPSTNRKRHRAKKDQSKSRAKKSSEKSNDSAEKRRAIKRTTRHLAVKSAEKLTEFEKSQLVKLNSTEIDEIASIKEISRAEIQKNKISLSEKYLIDCAKEKVTGQQSKISNVELSEKTLGRYFCKQCNKSYNRKHDLSRHMLTHTNEKPFECKFCDFKCALKSSLTKHERRHTEEKVERYKCHICQAYLASSGGLKRHIRIHTGARPFRCATCQKDFSRKDKLVRHLAICKGGEKNVGGEQSNSSDLVMTITPLGQEIMKFYTSQNSSTS